ncbi:unnamed protein product [Paramecium sonneborni]|uniref:Transmembrane protein n=1 Tax=Paramecium sonneborni TaxID=65129 RepID=A0A8S1NFL7_9CILI|nr:unnamed protein product [Paramecium sonneborni]
MKALQKPFIVRVLSDFYNSKLIFIGLALTVLGFNFIIIYKKKMIIQNLLYGSYLSQLFQDFWKWFLRYTLCQQLQNHVQIESEQKLSIKQIIGYQHSNYFDSKTIFIISIVFIVYGFISFIISLIQRKLQQQLDRKQKLSIITFQLINFRKNKTTKNLYQKFFCLLLSHKNDEPQLAFEAFQINNIEIILLTIIKLILIPFLIIEFSQLLTLLLKSIDNKFWKTIKNIYKRQIYNLNKNLYRIVLVKLLDINLVS